MIVFNHGKSYPPRRGIEPRSPAWQAGILTTILPRISPFSVATKFIGRRLKCGWISSSFSVVILENPGIDPGASRMQSERSPVWANSPLWTKFERGVYFFFSLVSARSMCVLRVGALRNDWKIWLLFRICRLHHAIEMLTLQILTKRNQQSGAEEACWAHNPEVGGSKPPSAT